MILRTGVPTVGAIPVSMMGTGALGAPPTYRDKVMGYGPIAYWMLAEAAGATAIDQVNSPLQDGTHVGVTLGQPGIGDGETCPLYDGANDYTNIYTVTFRGAFNGAEGTLHIWAKVFNVGVWTDAAIRYVARLYANASNFVAIRKTATNNRIYWRYRSGGVLFTISRATTTVDWMTLAMTWSASANELRLYYGGAQQGPPRVGLGVWAGNLATTVTVLGAGTTAGGTSWNGYEAHGAVWDVALTPAQIADLAIVV